MNPPGFLGGYLLTLKEIVMKQKIRYGKEIRERGVRMVLEQMDAYSSQWAAIESIAPKIGCVSQTLRKWVKQHEMDTGVGPVRTSDKERIKELERQNKELKQVNEILRKASAFFAQAELDRKQK